MDGAGYLLELQQLLFCSLVLTLFLLLVRWMVWTGKIKKVKN